MFFQVHFRTPIRMRFFVVFLLLFKEKTEAVTAKVKVLILVKFGHGIFISLGNYPSFSVFTRDVTEIVRKITSFQLETRF